MSRQSKRPPRASAQAAESDSETLFAALAEHSLAGIYLIQDEIFAYVNPRLAELFGYTSDELIGKKGPEALVHPEDWPTVRENIRRRVAREIESIDYCFRGRKKSGESFDVEVYGSRVTHEGKPAVIGTLLDITERKQAERALRESEDRFRRLSGAASEGIVVHEQGRILDANQTLADMFGYDLAELVGLNGLDLLAPESRDVVSKHIASGYEKPYEAICVRRDGSTFPVEIRAGTTHYQGRKVRVGAIRDMTERKQAEQALKESEEKYRKLIESANDAIFIADPETGIVIDANKKASQLLGIPGKKIVGMHQTQVHPKEEAGRYRQIFQEHVRTGKAISEDVFVRHKSGRKIPVEISASVIRFAGKTVIQGIFHDVTERKQAEERIRRLNRIYTVLSDINQTVVRVQDRNELFKETCRIAVEKGLFRLAWIGMVDDKSLLVKPVAHRGFNKGYLSKIKISVSTAAKDRGPVGAAIRQGKHFVCNDVERDRRKLPWREEAAKRGYRSYAAFPLRIGRHVAGSLNLCAGEPHFFDEQEIQLFDEAATDISFALQAMEQEELRRQAEQALRESEERLSAFMNSATDAFTLWDSKLNLVDLNATAMSYLPPGVQKQDIVGKNLQVLEPDVGPSGRLAHFRRVVETGEPFSIDVLRLHVVAGDEDRHVSLNVRAFKVGDGLGLITTDITERKQIEDALVRSEHRYRTMIECSNDLIWTLGTDGNFTYINKVAEEVSGYKAADWIGKSFAPLVPPDDLPRIQEIFLDTLAGNALHYTVDVRAADGSTFTVSVNTAPIFEHGEVVGTVSFGRDITEQVWVEQALRESEERYRRLVEASPDAIAVYVDDELTFVNAAAVDLFGAASPEELLGKSILDFVHEDGLERTEARVRRARDEHKALPLTEAKLVRLDGKRMDIEVALIPFDYEGQPAMQMVARDITERKQIDQLKSDFVAMASHELRSPLALIHSYAGLLAQSSKDRDPDACLKTAAKIHESTTLMKRIVDSLLDVSQIQSGTLKLTLEPVDLAELVTHSVQSVPVSEHHIIELDIATGLPPVHCDPDRLSVAIINLVSNAAKFSPEGRTVHVKVTEKAGRARIAVRDEGIGVAREDQARIFERFTQADMSSTRLFGGIGMGLYIAKHLVEAHGGHIEVKSAIDKGSTFTIDIPVDQP